MENIFDALNFSTTKEDTAYDLLLPQKDIFNKLTDGELEMEINTVNAYLESEPNTLASLYMVYIVAPKMGNYRRKIFTVIERRNTGRFPVEIFNHIDNEKNENIGKESFLDRISKIFYKPNVKIAVEDLFRQSKAISTNRGDQYMGI